MRTAGLWRLAGWVVVVQLLPWVFLGAWIEPALSGLFSREALPSDDLSLALVGVAVLSADGFLPIPSTLVMSSLGYFLGLFYGGLFASLGLFLSGYFAYEACYHFGPRLALRFISEEDLRLLGGKIEQLGAFGIAVTRAIPVLQETASCLAGLLRMPRKVYLPALLFGSLAAGCSYAAIGTLALSRESLALLLSIFVPAALWMLGRRFFRISR